VTAVFTKSIKSIVALIAAGVAIQATAAILNPPLMPLWTSLGSLLPALGAILGLGALHRVRSEVQSLGKDVGRLRKQGPGAPITGTRGPIFGHLARPINSLATQLAKPDPQARAHRQMIMDALRLVISGQPYETLDHIQRLGEMSGELARLAGLPREESELLRLAAPLHDLGMVGIPEEVRDKKGQFTPADARIMEKHTELGYRLLRKLEGPVCRAAAIIALEHHERWDGKGYPNRRSGDQLHVFSRIVAIVDMFDAMQSCRVHREAQSREKVLGIMRTQRGYHFDPQLLDIFMANLPVFFGILEAHGQMPELTGSDLEKRDACLI